MKIEDGVPCMSETQSTVNFVTFCSTGGRVQGHHVTRSCRDRRYGRVDGNWRLGPFTRSASDGVFQQGNNTVARGVCVCSKHTEYELANAHAQAWRAAGCVVVGAEFEADEEAGPKVFACMLPKIFYSQS